MGDQTTVVVGVGTHSAPCGSPDAAFAVAVGFAMTADNEVRWISVGLRCLTDDTLWASTPTGKSTTPPPHTCSLPLEIAPCGK